MDNELKLRVILFLDKATNSWNVQCLEHDIGAQAETIEESLIRLRVTILAEIEESIQMKEKPFARIPKAPDYFFEKWENRSGSFIPEREPELRYDFKQQYELRNEYALAP